MHIEFNRQTLNLNEPKIMGILNLTPNSFSDGGDYYDPERALARAYEMIEEGADILDIGAESTNPKASPISSTEEIKRLLPVIRKLKQSLSMPLSIDTFRAETMKVMIDEGVDIINDVTALSDPKSIEYIQRSDVAVILMHMLGDHTKMHITGDYEAEGGVTRSVKKRLAERIDLCLQQGISPKRIILDPGFGFDKSPEEQLQLLHQLEELTQSPYPYLVGVSRKRFIGTITGVTEAKERLAGNLAVALWSIEKGAKILRVHDVKATKEAFLMWQAMKNVQIPAR
ncbi:dihydropteroate synthase [Ignatzschineria ureiclastica]|uniref:Dihydropteroate synthase n=1 Tax=Ignatzschineria ureiclastica TaxID=472582 RepID=A0A2U2AF39_9GAMM|nr:dihydropteroate synthase [Ignatzschineria ureiclastica]PWD81263.1 dihydropteroate synthase [Ignatzschineria ureiclastica]GGZ97588.1 dihydropteroate synthase [Ignatzschineria ureiclastica]